VIPRVAIPASRSPVEVAGSFGADRDADVIFEGILGAARSLTGARYSALGVLNEQRDGLASFRTGGIDEELHQPIAQTPRGRGVLGTLILEPQPLRLRDVAQHPGSYGFPDHHPVMHSFLGVPVSIGDVVWGNLYLAEKTGGAFTEADQEVAVVLAGCAATAIATVRSRHADGPLRPTADAGGGSRQERVAGHPGVGPRRRTRGDSAAAHGRQAFRMRMSWRSDGWRASWRWS
jgi:signal transduction protein with GAF and PtsI domain